MQDLPPSAPTRVVITGASGIAAATALRLARLGRRVFVVSLDPGECAELATALGASCAGYCVADLRSEEAAVHAFESADAALGSIDGLVAVAGGSARKAGDGWLHDLSLDGWDAAIGLNLTTAFLATREAVRRMRQHGGSIVLTGSVLATAPQPEHFATHGYAAAKAAIAGWVTTLAAAYATDHIRINCVAPGLVATRGARRAAQSPAIRAFVERKQPLTGGMLDADDVAHVAVWLLDAPGTTGQVVRVDGGWSVTSSS